ncbi:MAG TPA: type II secretion system protein [Planctomycetaceae bacterium]
MTRRSSKRRIKHAFHPDTAGINPAARWGDSRSGFTLVEIMMVVTIIAILMTLTVKVVGAFLDQARSTATQSTLSKIQSLMNSRRQAFDRLTQRKGFFTTTPEYFYAQQTSKSPTMNMPSSAIKPYASKLLQMKYFPQSASDLNNLMTLLIAADPTGQLRLQFQFMYPKLFQNPLPSSAPFTVPNLTNQEILYNILTENVIGDSPLGTDSFTASEVVTEPPTANPQTAGMPYFIDAWKGPIKFYRWPTRLFRSGGMSSGTLVAITHSQSPNPTSANADGSYDVTNAMIVFSNLPVFTGQLWNDLARDPDDPLQSCLLITNFETTFHTPATFHMPIIVSAGPDGLFGLLPPDGPAATFGPLAALQSGAADQLTDNIVSASIKAGGK